MEASEPKWVKPVLNIIGVNSLRLGGLHITLTMNFTWNLKRKYWSDRSDYMSLIVVILSYTTNFPTSVTVYKFYRKFFVV